MTTLKSTAVEGNTLELDADGSRAGEIALRIRRRGESIGRIINVEGPALRDALLEAFPLPVEKPVKRYGSVVKPTRTFVPGMVLEYSEGRGGYYVVLPGDKLYSLQTHKTLDDYDQATLNRGDSTVVFDHRDAVALPSPLGIRVGDTVRRVTEHDGVTETVEFQVNHIGHDTGLISAKYGTSYSPVGFEVVSREVPDRLPAGTITRDRDNGTLYLVTTEGHISLKDGFVVTRGNGPTADTKSGKHEVIYLPES